MSENRTAFILAAGLGTRLKEMTENRPKALVELNGKPLISHVIDNLTAQGFNKFVVNIHHLGDMIKNYLTSTYPNLIIIISDESAQLMDTGGAIIKALPHFADDKAILIHNTDIVSDIDLRTAYDNFVKSNDDAWLITQDRNSSRKLLFDNNLLIGWKNSQTKEHKWANNPSDRYTELSFNGIHIAKPEIFDGFELKKCSVIDLYLKLAREHRIASLEAECSFWFDLGKKEQLEQAETQLKK